VKLVEGNAIKKGGNCTSSETKPHSFVSLDEIDRTMLQMLQDDFPIVQHPWLEISGRLNISEDEVLSRLKRLVESDVIVKIGPIFDSSRIGLKAATLIAVKVPKDKVNDFARIINEYDNVSHNYEREDEYNVWFTLAASSNGELASVLDEIKQKTCTKDHDILNLPTVRRFKINVHFQLT
jgi:DNA-binding Lrp family transcriptional regulator